MALTIVNSSARGPRILYSTPTKHHPYTHLPHRPFLLPLSNRSNNVLVSAKKLSARTGRFDSRNRKSTPTSGDQDQERTAEIERTGPEDSRFAQNGGVVAESSGDGYFLPELPGDKPNFWEGPQWDALGFFVQYLWAFGIVFALIACGIAVATYNEGATDFKSTPAYKESTQSQELLEEPEESNSDIFESNPTEVAPSLE